MFDVNGFQVQQIDDVMVVGQQIKQVSSLWNSSCWNIDWPSILWILSSLKNQQYKTTQFESSISWVEMSYNSNGEYQLNWSCGGINKYPALKICQSMWTGWRLPTILNCQRYVIIVILVWMQVSSFFRIGWLLV
jgi:hypothetical protein